MEARELKDKASALFTKGRFAKAAELYEEFCVLDKRDHQARLRCGDAWSKAGKKDKAIANYSLAAEGYAKDGFLPRAIAASKLVLEIDPSHKGVQKMLAELYAQKSGGSRPSGPARGSSPSAVAGAPGSEMEVTRSVAAPVTSSFTNRKNAIDLDAPVPEKTKPAGYRPAPTEAASPMNRADALELPEYEIPMDDGPSHVGGMAAAKGPAPQRRADAIEIDMQDAGDSGPKALVETSIDIELTPSQPVTGEIEIPIEGQPLTDADQLPPELQVGTPHASAVSFDLAAPPPLDFELDVPAPSAPSGQVYELTEELPEPKPSAPIYDLTDEDEAEAAAPEPAPPPSFSIEDEPSTPLVVSGVPEIAAPVPPSIAPVVASEVAAQQPHSTQAAAVSDAPAAAQELVAHAPASHTAATHAPATHAHATRSNALPPAVGDAASAPPSIRPMAASEGQPPGLKPRRAEAAAPAAPANVPVSSASSRIWLPPAFTPAAVRAEGDPPRPAVEASVPVTAPSEPSTDLERSLQTFMEFDPDAPAPRPAAAPAPPPAAHASFTELDLDESDSLLHSLDAAASSAAPHAAVVEEAMEPDESHLQQGGLPKIPLFSDLPEDAFIALFEKCPLQRFEEGQLVFEEGDKADAFYVICAGQVRVFRSDAGARRDLATLDEGSFFGEMALLSEAPRSASVEAGSEDTQVLVISAEILKELSSSYPVVATALKKFCRQRMLSNLMNQAALFAPFNKNDRRDLVQKFRARDVNKGDVLVKEGASSDGLYLVLSGEVEIEAKGRRIATLKEGQVFGEMSLLMRSPASATVRALRHTSLLRLPKHDFDSLILSHPQVLEHVASLIDERKKADQKRQ